MERLFSSMKVSLKARREAKTRLITLGAKLHPLTSFKLNESHLFEVGGGIAQR